jgi:hypothetical protein
MSMPSGQVTMADLFQVLTRIQTDLAKALTRLEVVDARNAAADKLDSDHEGRLRSLEAFRWKLTGVMCLLSLFSGTGGVVIGWALTRH